VADTRRQLFKTSVLSAVGVASASLLAGCATNGANGACPPVIVGFGRDAQWYAFQYKALLSGGFAYLAFVLMDPSLIPTQYPSQVPYDVEKWFAYASGQNALKPVTPPVASITMDNGDTFYLNSNPANPNQLSDASTQQLCARVGAAIAKWNEIGLR